MKNWLYLPFLVLMAVTYTRLVDNYNSEENLRMSRGPASVLSVESKAEYNTLKKSDENCEDIAARFNPHLNKNCL